MIHYKKPEDIEKMRKGGKILADVLWEVIDEVRPGISEIELEELANQLINDKGAEPAFKKVKGYKYATCISTNNVVVHGVPTDYKLKEGDLIGIDCGVYYEGFNTDMSETVRVSKKGESKKDDVDKFIQIGKDALSKAIQVAVVGNRVGDISRAIQENVEGGGYSIVRSLIGHGVGKKLHEDPEIPGFLDKKIEDTPELESGMTIAIEVIYNMGSEDVSFNNKDGWTIGSSDGSFSGLFERTVAITKKGTEVLT